MKTIHKKNSQRGFTVAEMVVSTMVMAILGIVFLQVLNSGMILYAKNTAVNSAHEEAREGINRLTRDIHAAVSVPQLRDCTADANHTVAASFITVSSAPVGGTPPTAAGISFQNIVPGSPDFVWKDPNNANLIMIKDNPNPPIGVAGLRDIVAAFRARSQDFPVCGIAGIDASNAAAVIAAGADGLAVISALSMARDPQGAARALRGIVDQALAQR